MPYVSYAKTRKEERDIKISNHPYKSQSEKDEAIKRIVQRQAKAVAGKAKKPKKKDKSALEKTL